MEKYEEKRMEEIGKRNFGKEQGGIKGNRKKEVEEKVKRGKGKIATNFGSACYYKEILYFTNLIYRPRPDRM